MGMEGTPNPPQMPVDAILAEDSVAAGVAALERIHGRHLADMNAEEQAEARDHWRRQVEEILVAVRGVHGGTGTPGAGRAVITFADAGEERVDVSVSFQPDLEELGDGQVAGTPAQVLALSALESLSDEEPPAAPDA
jgi:alpha-D-ribose 1-methylphosphonate 5-triphosphate synthase subunit PhnG